MIIRDVIDALERFAPLPLQDDYDNSGLQVGLTETEVSGALLCLDITEEVIREAISLGFNLIVSHHPLLFAPLRSITDGSSVGRCVIEAIRNGITIYSSHTCLDNARGGVNYEIASRLGLQDLDWLEPKTNGSGSGLTGLLTTTMYESAFVDLVKSVFGVKHVRCNGNYDKPIHKVAVCGGSGAFLIPKAIATGADAFVTGEIGYHRLFGHDGEILLIELGHYESEQFTVDLLYSLLRHEIPALRLEKTRCITNPVRCK